MRRTHLDCEVVRGAIASLFGKNGRWQPECFEQRNGRSEELQSVNDLRDSIHYDRRWKCGNGW
jgi:hypothetical protein